MIVNLTLSMVTDEPTFRRLDFAYPESVTATSASESAELKEWPEVIVAELSGPSEVGPVSTPSMLKLFGCGGALPPAAPKFLGNVIDVSVSVSPPAAAVTSRSFATVATFDALMAPYSGTTWSIVIPAAFSHLPLVQISAPPGPPWMLWLFWLFRDGALPVFGGPGAAPVTVTSVPTPYSALSTSDWAFFTPADAAATVTTRPTPRARPSAMKIAWRIRRRSSRRT